jgi:hypothetical protein
MNTRTTNRLFKQLDEVVTDLKGAFEHLSNITHDIVGNRCNTDDDLEFELTVNIGELVRTAALLCPAHALLLERLATELLRIENDEEEDIDLPSLPHAGGVQ